MSDDKLTDLFRAAMQKGWYWRYAPPIGIQRIGTDQHRVIFYRTGAGDRREIIAPTLELLVRSVRATVEWLEDFGESVNETQSVLPSQLRLL